MGKSLSMPKSISKKLMAATSMLLVATIMMVSSTYAWFTLSTAPEVTGISTTVGANGNLEIALASYVPGGDGVQPVDTWANPQLIPSGEGTSGVNETWGNLVDLENDGLIQYGLDKIQLMPARLNLDADGTIAESILKTPSYGADGRISDLIANTVTGTYDSTSSSFKSNDAHGVRAIGAATAMTDRQMAYRDAKNAISSNANVALRYANQSLYSNGGALVGLAMKKALNKPYSTADVTALETMVGQLEQASVSLEEMMRSFVAAMITSAKNTENDATALTAKGQLSNLTYDQIKAAFTTYGGVTGMTQTELGVLDDVFEKVDAVKASVSDAKTTLTALKAVPEAELSWANFSPVVNELMNFDNENLTLNGFKISEVEANQDKLAADAMKNGGLALKMGPETGIYADIADICGNIDTSVTLTEETGFGGVPVYVDTESVISPAYSVQISNIAITAGSPETDDAAESVAITDLYGYAIDLIFRTNASKANLLLQTNAINRIYANSTEETTMGGGSNMTFTSISADYTPDMMKELMGAIRVVFVDKEGNILQRAKLDTTTAQPNEVGEIKADLKLYTVDATTKVETITGENELTALQQNIEKQISVIVYLDGDLVDNSMVANGEYSMTGYLNLQFATDATLVPMDYTQFQQVTSGDASSN